MVHVPFLSQVAFLKFSTKKVALALQLCNLIWTQNSFFKMFSALEFLEGIRFTFTSRWLNITHILQRKDWMSFCSFTSSRFFRMSLFLNILMQFMSFHFRSLESSRRKKWQPHYITEIRWMTKFRENLIVSHSCSLLILNVCCFFSPSFY